MARVYIDGYDYYEEIVLQVKVYSIVTSITANGNATFTDPINVYNYNLASSKGSKISFGVYPEDSIVSMQKLIISYNSSLITVIIQKGLPLPQGVKLMDFQQFTLREKKTLVPMIIHTILV
jgi:hypothetical protein